jgi:hyaluronan synthase
VGTVFPILFVRLIDLQSTIFWAYSIAVTGFLLFMYLSTNRYNPVPDLGLRPRVTVIIPAKNEEEAIVPVVRAVLNSDYPISNVELVVVDDGSTDNTWTQLQTLKRDPGLSNHLILVRHERNYGKRVALASGARIATGEIIVCIDSDSFVDKDAIKLLVQPFQDEHVTAVCGHGEAANMVNGLLAKLQHYWYQEMFRLWKGMESRFGCVTCCSGILSAYRRTAIEPLLNQWLSERLPGTQSQSNRHTAIPITGPVTSRLVKSPGEDRVLTAFALSGKDSRVVYQSNAVVRTIVPANFNQFLKQQLRWMRSWVHCSLLQGRFMWKKPLPVALIFYLYQFLVYLSPAVVIIWLFIEPFRGQWLGTAGFLAGTIYVGFLHGLNSWKYLRTSIESVPYRTMFVFISLFLILTVVLYGWATPWKGGWLTRDQVPASLPIAEPVPLPFEPVLVPA